MCASRSLFVVVAALFTVPSLIGVVHADDTTEHDRVRQIDELLEQSWKSAGVEPAPPASDAEFLRRAFLDLTGVIPTATEVRDYLSDDDPQKRMLLIDQLLTRPGHAEHLSRIWRDQLIETNNQAIAFGQSAGFETWLFQQFLDNTPYDSIVRDIITASGQLDRPSPVYFFTSLELKPEKLAAATAESFLGIQIQCAECHQHPFDHWKQRDFWGFAAFFAQLDRSQNQGNFFNRVADTTEGEVNLPGTEEIAPLLVPVDRPVEQEPGTSRRELLARWITSNDNPYFARATVNQVWAILFGYGIVEPVNDFSERNPPSHPEILNLLATDFIAHGYDLRRLFRILTNTRAYQLTSETLATDDQHTGLFSRMVKKSLSAEQIYDCLAQATIQREFVNSGNRVNQFNNQFFGLRQQFLAKFEAPTQKKAELQTGIPQALTMMNGQLMTDLTDPATSDLLAALINSPFLTTAERVEVLFLTTVNRFPRDDEIAKLVPYVESGGPAHDADKALGDVLWALLNSTEFILNH